MSVAIITDSGADLTPEQQAANEIQVVPLIVTLGSESYRSGVEMSPDEFWDRIAQPGAPFPGTAAPSLGAFVEVFEQAFARGADSVVYVGISSTLSATLTNGQMAAAMQPRREIHVVDSRSASMAVGLLALRGAALARAGASGAEIALELTRLRARTRFFVALDTLDYLRRGGRISGARAAIGTLLSVKPIFTIDAEGTVVPADQPRTPSRARRRIIELITARPLAGLVILSTPGFDPEPFRDEVLAALPGPLPSNVSCQMIGPVIGTHVGPRAYGAVLLTEP